MEYSLFHRQFYILDLASQGMAIEKLLWGLPHEQKIAWLTARGRVEQIPTQIGFPVTYRFTSTVGLERVFFWGGDELVFIGDHSTYRPPTSHDWQ